MATGGSGAFAALAFCLLMHILHSALADVRLEGDGGEWRGQWGAFEQNGCAIFMANSSGKIAFSSVVSFTNSIGNIYGGGAIRPAQPNSVDLDADCCCLPFLASHRGQSFMHKKAVHEIISVDLR